MPVKALVVPEITIDIDAVGDGMAAGMRTYVVTHTYPANAFYFMPGDIIKMSGFSNLAPGKIDMAGFSAEAIA